jgi:hypothetical protein
MTGPVKIRLRGGTKRVQGRTRKYLKKTDTEVLRTDRIPRERGLLRRIQETEYRTEKITFLIYVV